MPDNLETIRLTLAMAFGQGTVCMMADEAAIQSALSANEQIITTAFANWDTYAPAFLNLVRLFGQLSATHAAQNGRGIITEQDVRSVLPIVLSMCPCIAPARRGVEDGRRPGATDK